MSGPGPMAIMQAIATTIATTPTAGIVVLDPLYDEQGALERYASMLRTAGSESVDGWLIGNPREEPELQAGMGVDGYSQLTRVDCWKMMSVSADATGCPSRLAFDTSVLQAKAALRANRTLGLNGSGTNVNIQENLHSPTGYTSGVFGEFRLHVMTGEMLIFVKFC